MQSGIAVFDLLRSIPNEKVSKRLYKSFEFSDPTDRTKKTRKVESSSPKYRHHETARQTATEGSEQAFRQLSKISGNMRSCK